MSRPRVVLVGNGPSALAFEAGALIDACDVVVRFNEYPQAGYEPFVGSRTDVWVTNGISDDLSRAANAASVLICPPYTRRREAADRHAALTASKRTAEIVPPALVERVEQAFRFHVTSKGWGTRYPSTGALAAAYFTERHERLYVHGFDCFAEGNHHYFDAIPAEEGRTWHDAAAEAGYLEELAMRGRVLRLPRPLSGIVHPSTGDDGRPFVVPC